MTLAERLWSRVSVDLATGCWEFTGYREKGYGRIGLGRRNLLAHRAAWLLTHVIIPDDLDVLHQCDNPPCVNPAHLYLGTHADNMRDMTERGRRRPPPRCEGSRHGIAKLTEAQVVAMRSEASAGRTHTSLAAAYGVSRSAVGAIVRLRRWRHV